MGPTCNVRFTADVESILPVVDSVLESSADQVERTRKGRGWDIWLDGRPIHVNIDGTSSHIALSAGCNDAEDVKLLQQLSVALAMAVGGVTSEPTK